VNNLATLAKAVALLSIAQIDNRPDRSLRRLGALAKPEPEGAVFDLRDPGNSRSQNSFLPASGAKIAIDRMTDDVLHHIFAESAPLLLQQQDSWNEVRGTANSFAHLWLKSW